MVHDNAPLVLAQECRAHLPPELHARLEVCLKGLIGRADRYRQERDLLKQQLVEAKDSATLPSGQPCRASQAQEEQGSDAQRLTLRLLEKALRLEHSGVLTSLTLQARLKTLLVELAAGMGLTELAIVLMPGHASVPELVVSSGSSRLAGESPTPSCSTLIVEQVWKTGVPQHSKHALQDPSFQENRTVQRLETEAFLCLPLRAGRKRGPGVLWLERGAQHPFSSDDQTHLLALARCLEPLVTRYRDQLQERSARVDFHTLRQDGAFQKVLGQSPVLEHVLRRAGKAAQSPDSTLLLTGPTGTGKEVLARAIHEHPANPRRNKPFVAINVAAIPSALLEAELFGTKAGAFTDAKKARSGRFVEAQGGTLLLDEVGDLPLDLQVKLLRVLQEREVTPLGGEHAKRIKLDVRVIAATCKKLEAMVRDKTFREDLFYRLNQLPIEIPALQERREDIPLLAESFLSAACQTERRTARGLPDLRLTPESLCWLQEQPWEGNVRQLENLMRRMAVLVEGDQVTLEALQGDDHAPGITRIEPTVAPVRGAMQQLWAEQIAQALQQTGGKKGKAANLLGIDRATFYRRARHMRQEQGLEWVTQDSNAEEP